MSTSSRHNQSAICGQPSKITVYNPQPATYNFPAVKRYKYTTGRELEKARESEKGVTELSDKDFDAFSALLRGLTNR